MISGLMLCMLIGEIRYNKGRKEYQVGRMKLLTRDPISFRKGFKREATRNSHIGTSLFINTVSYFQLIAVRAIELEELGNTVARDQRGNPE